MMMIVVVVVDVQIEVPVCLPDGAPCDEVILSSPYHESSSLTGSSWYVR